MGGIDSSFDDWDEKRVTMDNQGRSNTAASGPSGRGNTKYPYS